MKDDDEGPVFWGFEDLRRHGIVSNRTTLRRWIAEEGFPRGVKMGPARRAYKRADVLAWCDSRPA